jgi:hypothetical protein
MVAYTSQRNAEIAYVGRNVSDTTSGKTEKTQRRQATRNEGKARNNLNFSKSRRK